MDNFGYQTIGVYSMTITDYIGGSNAICPESGTANSITAYLKMTIGTSLAKCALYDSNKNLVTNGVTNAITISSTAQWYTFPFSTPKPSLTAQTYYIVVLAQSGTCACYRDTGATGYVFHYEARDYDLGFPSTIDGTDYANQRLSIYCTYTPAAAVGFGVSKQFLVLTL